MKKTKRLVSEFVASLLDFSAIGKFICKDTLSVGIVKMKALARPMTVYGLAIFSIIIKQLHD